MKNKLLILLKKVGHAQAVLMLSLFFFLVLTPYGLLLRCLRRDLLPGGSWEGVEHPQATLESLRRSF